MKFPNPVVSAVLLALALVLLSGVAAAFLGGEPARDPLAALPRIPREWQSRAPLSLDFMVRDLRLPTVEDMYARPR